MKKPYLFTILLFIVFLATSCAKPEPSTVNDAPITSTSQTVLNVTPKPLTPQDEYIALVESYIDDATFKQMDEPPFFSVFAGWVYGSNLVVALIRRVSKPLRHKGLEIHYFLEELSL